jgi:hypothetical protein
MDLRAIADRAGLVADAVRPYLVERAFRVYEHFPVGYQFLFPFANYGATLPSGVGHAYAALATEFVVELTSRMSSFLDEQVVAWRDGGCDGLHSMMVCTRPAEGARV